MIEWNGLMGGYGLTGARFGDQIVPYLRTDVWV